MRARSSSRKPGGNAIPVLRTAGLWPASGGRDARGPKMSFPSSEQLLHDRAGAGEVDHAGMALAQHAHDAAHILDPGGAGLGDCGFGRGGDLLVAHLLRQKALDDRDLVFFALRQLRTVALLIKRSEE